MQLSMESYYRTPEIDENNIECLDSNLYVNCCGRVVLDRRFSTHNPEGRHDYYLLYMWSGELLMKSGNKSTHMKAGDLILIPPHTEYFYQSLEDSITYFWIHFTGKDVAPMLEELWPDGFHATAGLSESVHTAFRELFTEFIFRDQHMDLATKTLLSRILVMLARRSTDIRSTDFSIQLRIKTSLHYIHQHLASSISIDSLAQMEHLSTSRYRTVFNECMDCSPSEYIINLRINRACELMEQFNMTIAEAASAVGYQDPLYFSRIFRKKMGTSPSSYLKRR